MRARFLASTRRPAVAIATAAALLLACSSSEPSDKTSEPAADERAMSAAVAVTAEQANGTIGGGATAQRSRGLVLGDVARDASVEAAPPPPPAPPATVSPSPAATASIETDGPMIIRTGSATVRVDSLDRGIARLRQVALGIPGAYLANLSVESGRDQPRRATLEIKVPAARFDALVAGLAPIGVVEGVTVNAMDVGEEFVDVNARAANARRLETRLIELLATRTGRLQDVLAVERELARVREEIERYEGRLRFLRTRAAVSTLSVSLHEPLPVLGDQPGASPIADAVRQAWQNLVAFVAALIAMSGVLVPLGLLAWLAWILTRRYRRPESSPAA